MASDGFQPPVMDKTLAHLASFIYDSYPESRPLSAPPLAPWFDFPSLLALSTPESHCLPSVSLPWPLVSQGGGGGLHCVWVTLRGTCALTIFAVRWV